MAEPIWSFISQLNSDLRLNENFIVKKRKRYFLMNNNLKRFVKKDFYYAGAYLGKVKERIFFPSFILLSMMAPGRANKTVVDDKSAWLFVCGRDVFKRGIINVAGSKSKGDYTLVLNRRNECLGFGRIQHDINDVRDENKVVVKSISDIGDFLRREKHHKQ